MHGMGVSAVFITIFLQACSLLCTLPQPCVARVDSENRAQRRSDDGQVVISCNETLEAGSVLRLTNKLDLSGRGSHPADPYACGIFGPSAGKPAEIHLPENDCLLLAQGAVSIRGQIRFIRGSSHDNNIDCCDDGEGHGNVLCSYTNVTFEEGSEVTVEAESPDSVITPGGFWSGKYIHIHGRVEASLLPGQMNGVNGLISSTGVSVSSTGKVIVSGAVIARGAAIQGGDYGTYMNGGVECSNYNSSDSGGCIAGGKFLQVGPFGNIRASNGAGDAAGLVISSDNISAFQGNIFATNLSTTNAGSIVAGNVFEMEGNASIVGENLYAGGGSSVVASTNFTLGGTSFIFVNNSWGGDGGAIGVTRAVLKDKSRMHCENSYADNCGGCILADTVIRDDAAFFARNVTGNNFAGAICGGYPGQNLTIVGNSSVVIEASRSNLYGGALLAHEIQLGGASTSGDAFKVHLKDAAASCGAAIATLGSGEHLGQGKLSVDGSGGGILVIENARETNTTLGCLNIESNIVPTFAQPCSSCASPDFPSSKKNQCACKAQQSEKLPIRECCSK